ncbi:HAD hydrolase family protein [bacterium]|nr:HAD hydrolase family protein [bacterium]
MAMILPKTIKMVITDFDGIMTDNCMYISDSGDCSRKINFKDVMGIHLLKKNGFDIAIISGEKNHAIELLADKFDIKEVHMQIRKKIDVLKSIVEKYSLTQEEYVYIGDDVNDLESLEFAKYRVTVPHALQKLKDVDGIQITEADGGDGAFREVVECLIG